MSTTLGAAFTQHNALANEIARGADTSTLTEYGYSEGSVEAAEQLGVVQTLREFPMAEDGQLVMDFDPTREESWYIPPVSIEERAIGLKGVLRVFAKQNSSRGLHHAVRRKDYAPEIRDRIGSSKLHSIVLPISKANLDPQHAKAEESFATAGGYNKNTNQFFEDWDDFNVLYLGATNAKNRKAFEKTLDEVIDQFGASPAA